MVTRFISFGQQVPPAMPVQTRTAEHYCVLSQPTNLNRLHADPGSPKYKEIRQRRNFNGPENGMEIYRRCFLSHPRCGPAVSLSKHKPESLLHCLTFANLLQFFKLFLQNPQRISICAFICASRGGKNDQEN